VTGAITQTTWIAASAVATLLLALATFAFVIAAFRQLPILRDSQRSAANSATAAARAADAAEASVEVSQQAAREQSIASVYPLLFMTVRPVPDGFALSLANRGTAPAVDVAIYTFATFNEEDVPLAAFADEWIQPDVRAEVLETGASSDGAWALRDHLYYPNVPPRQQVVASCACPLEPSSVTVLLQTRDVLGRNFARVEWHFYVAGESRYRSGVREGFSAEEVPRLDFEAGPLEPSEQLSAATLNSIDALQGAVGNLRLHAFSVGWVQGIGPDWEDRGVWEDV
jgi:hypothetical protein